MIEEAISRSQATAGAAAVSASEARGQTAKTASDKVKCSYSSMIHPLIECFSLQYWIQSDLRWWNSCFKQAPKREKIQSALYGLGEHLYHRFRD